VVVVGMTMRRMRERAPRTRSIRKIKRRGAMTNGFG
jgi:hypothetical protein